MNAQPAVPEGRKMPLNSSLCINIKTIYNSFSIAHKQFYVKIYRLRKYMPTILLIMGWRLFFYANEGNEPIHVHCRKGDTEW